MTRNPASKGDAPTELAAEDTLRGAVAKMTGRFAAAGIDTPDVDARFLLCGILGIDGLELIKSDHKLGENASALTTGVLRRLAREPVSRILGERMFYGRAFEITPDVLDPRPDTETVIDATLDIIRKAGGDKRTLTIADVGTGSGAILVTLLCELPLARGLAVDVSRASLAVAGRNARRHAVADRFEVVHARGLQGLVASPEIIVSNPPYIPTRDIPALGPEVRDFDPHLALDGGPDGLKVFREIANDISRLGDVGAVILEVGSGQHAAVVQIFTEIPNWKGQANVSLLKDLAGHVRCVTIEPKI